MGYSCLGGVIFQVRGSPPTQAPAWAQSPCPSDVGLLDHGPSARPWAQYCLTPWRGGLLAPTLRVSTGV